MTPELWGVLIGGVLALAGFALGIVFARLG